MPAPGHPAYRGGAALCIFHSRQPGPCDGRYDHSAGRVGPSDYRHWFPRGYPGKDAPVRAWDNHPEPRAGLCYPAQVHPSKIGLLVSLVEAYDGLAVVRTKDAAAGIVEFWISA